MSKAVVWFPGVGSRWVAKRFLKKRERRAMYSRCLRTAVVDLAPWSSRTHAGRPHGGRAGLERRRLVAPLSEPQERADAFEAPQSASPPPSSSSSSPPSSSSPSPSPVADQERPKGHFLAAASVGFGVALVRPMDTRCPVSSSLLVSLPRTHSDMYTRSVHSF